MASTYLPTKVRMPKAAISAPPKGDRRPDWRAAAGHRTATASRPKRLARLLSRRSEAAVS